MFPTAFAIAFCAMHNLAPCTLNTIMDWSVARPLPGPPDWIDDPDIHPYLDLPPGEIEVAPGWQCQRLGNDNPRTDWLVCWRITPTS